MWQAKSMAEEHEHDWIANSPQWLVYAREDVQVSVRVTQAQPLRGQEFVPVWLALYRMKNVHQMPRNRSRLFRAKGLRVAAGEGFFASEEVTLNIQELQASESEQTPYVLVVGAMAESKQRSFDIKLCAKPLADQSGSVGDPVEMRRWVPPSTAAKKVDDASSPNQDNGEAAKQLQSGLSQGTAKVDNSSAKGEGSSSSSSDSEEEINEAEEKSSRSSSSSDHEETDVKQRAHAKTARAKIDLAKFKESENHLLSS